MKLVLDASIVVNVVTTQRLTIAAERWMELPVEILAPDFLRIEVANALWKVENAGLMDSRNADLAWRHIQHGDIRFIPDREHLDRARVLARNLHHPIYDCLYLAVAEAHEATLITADRRLHGVAVEAAQVQGTGYTVAWVEDEPPQL